MAQISHDAVARPTAPRPQVQNVGLFISELVCAAYRLRPAALETRTRGCAEIARARQTAIYLARVVLGKTFAEAGALFKRDRSTAAHACRLVEEWRDDPVFDHVIAELEACLRNAAVETQP